MRYVADFETTVTNPVRVWLWGLIDENFDFKFGTDIEDFMRFVMSLKSPVIYFHNLKFDGQFLLWFLLAELGLYQLEELGKGGDKITPRLETLISEHHLYYSVSIVFSDNKVVFQDSLKVLPMSVKEISKAFKFGRKTSINYIFDRDEGYVPTEQELEYIYNDVSIVMHALKVQYSEGLNRMTIAANALGDYKRSLGKGNFKRLFPILHEDIDKFLRKSYRGGVVWLNPVYAEKVINYNGCVYDVNSMYPWAMTQMLPYGEPKFIMDDENKYKKSFPLLIGLYKIEMKLKEGKIPCLLNRGRFGCELIIDTDELTEFVLTNVDVDNIMDSYDVSYMEFVKGYRFKCTNTLFTDYLDKWIKVKENNIGGLRTLAKLMLNSLYGKFAKNPDNTKALPYLTRNGIDLFTGEREISDSVYVAVSSFITAYSRRKLISAGNLCYDRFIYCDTDSLHLIGSDIPNLDIDNVKLGCWKHEATFNYAKFLHSKCYVENIDKGLKVTVAGLPSHCHRYVVFNKVRTCSNHFQETIFDNFKIGSVYPNKLIQQSVYGGAILKSVDFKIRRI